MRRLPIALLFALSALPVCFVPAALAEGPGTRIRSGSPMPRVPPPASDAKSDKSDPCARPRAEDRGLCIEKAPRHARRPVQTGDVPGPGSVSGTSGAGSSSSSGTTGGGSLGAGAPR